MSFPARRFLFFLFSALLAMSSAAAENAPAADDAAETGLPRIRITGGGGFGWYNSSVAKSVGTDLGKFATTANASFAYHILPGTGLYLGVETGIYYWGVTSTYSSGTKYDTEAVALPFLAMVMYQFDVWERAKLFVDAGVGPALYAASEKYADTSTNRTSDSSVFFEGVFGFGVDIYFGRHFGLTIEPKLGVLDGTLLYLTTFTALFRF